MPALTALKRKRGGKKDSFIVPDDDDDYLLTPDDSYADSGRDSDDEPPRTRAKSKAGVNVNESAIAGSATKAPPKASVKAKGKATKMAEGKGVDNKTKKGKATGTMEKTAEGKPKKESIQEYGTRKQVFEWIYASRAAIQLKAKLLQMKILYFQSKRAKLNAKYKADVVECKKLKLKIKLQRLEDQHVAMLSADERLKKYQDLANERLQGHEQKMEALRVEGLRLQEQIAQLTLQVEELRMEASEKDELLQNTRKKLCAMEVDQARQELDAFSE